jgi:hypothetical protein
LVAGGFLNSNDKAILAVMARFPDMPIEEANEYIERIDDDNNIPVCYALLGRIGAEMLGQEARQVFDEFQRWSQDRAQRIRNEQGNARKRRLETRLALKMIEWHERGRISDQTLLMYGISGALPERNTYMAMSPAEKERLWADRMENRFGPNWVERFSNRNLPLPTMFKGRQREPSHINWSREGF